MTPKEKAEELVKLYAKLIWDEKEFKMELYKQCALIAVDEIDLLIQRSTPKDDPYGNLFALEYWEEVKQEIELL